VIFSDHFVRFYNEVFKYLDRRGGGALEKYYLEISRHQELHCLELFREKGLQGVHDYYVHIIREENCDCGLELTEDCLHLSMRGCPSLGKVLDNDAAPSAKYCDHCPGWCLPLYAKAGLYCLFDTKEHDKPSCEKWVFHDREKANAKYGELKPERRCIRTNW